MGTITAGVIGMGLMGGSLCKALGAEGHRVLGRDADEHVQKYALLTGIMQGVIKLNVPLTVECNYGSNWLEAH